MGETNSWPLWDKRTPPLGRTYPMVSPYDHLCGGDGCYICEEANPPLFSFDDLSD